MNTTTHDGLTRQPAEGESPHEGAILDGVPLIAPAVEGLHSLELANAMLLSAWTSQTVELPLNAALYEKWLKRKIAAGRKSGS